MGILAINVSVTAAGTPQRVYTPDLTANKPVLGSDSIQIQADPANTAGKYVYIGTKGMVASSRTNILAVLSPGQVWPQGNIGGVDPEFLYVDADTTGDKINVAVAG
jgi:hypothetical protein